MSTPEYKPPSSEPSPPSRTASIHRGAGPGDREPEQSREREPEAVERSRRGLPIWLFVLLILVFAGAFSWQYRLASGLEVQVANLEAKLVAANSLVGAHQGRLREIRGGVRDLATQIESLKALVDADPTSGAPNPSLPATSSRSEGSRRLDATRSNPSPRDPILDIPARLPQ